MEFYLHYRNGNVVGYSTCPCFGDDFECVKVDEQTYLNHLDQEKQKDDLRDELNQLTNWFTDYDVQVSQYTRCQRLGVEFDKNINELDAQAVINAKRIKELRVLLNG